MAYSVAIGLIPYLEGRLNTTWIIPPLFPTVSLPWLLLFVACAVLFLHTARSLFSKRHRAAVAFLFFLSLLFLRASWTVHPDRVFRWGFSDYARTVLTADEWREISRMAQENLRPQIPIRFPPYGVGGTAEEQLLWSKFTATTQIQKLDDSFRIVVSPGETCITWGGPLVGHRSIVIFTHQGDQLREAPGDQLIAQDIFTSVSSD
ncbi:hypothetical protein [Chthoniobacter flavus]|nr:hypothetical protein [Chthoniobacter flavus]